MGLPGYAGKVLRIDVERQMFDVDELDTSAFKNFLGSRGLGAFLLSKTLRPKVEPLSPDNPLIFMTGPLTGTKFLSTPKYAAVTKSPLTGFYTHSLASGRFGLSLKSRGYDGILITGKAEKSTYISLTEKGVGFHDAGPLWGMNTCDDFRFERTVRSEGRSPLYRSRWGKPRSNCLCVFGKPDSWTRWCWSRDGFQTPKGNRDKGGWRKSWAFQ